METLNPTTIFSIVNEINTRPAEYWNASISTSKEWVIKETHSGKMTRIPGQPWVQETHRQYDGDVVESSGGDKEVIIEFLKGLNCDCEVAYVNHDDDPWFHEVAGRRIGGKWYK
ncbi:hypothetical protein ACFHYJ_00830 [Pasteurella multocida]